MNRREFLKKSTMAGLGGIGLLNSLGKKTIAAPTQDGAEVIVAQDGEPEQLLKAALESYGGLGKLVKPGMTVVIKANFSWYQTAEEAANTNPNLLAALTGACYEAGAKKVRVVDISIDYYRMSLDESGIKEAVEKVGGEIENLSPASYTNLSTGVLDRIPGFRVCTEALEADCLINVPILKHHRVTDMTGAVKNLMGLTPDRRLMHSVNIHEAIADLAKLIKPHLHIMDAYRILKTNGPQGPGEVVEMKQVILSHDPVAVDTYGSSLIGRNPMYLKLVGDAGLGCNDINKINIKRVQAG